MLREEGLAALRLRGIHREGELRRLQVAQESLDSLETARVEVTRPL